MKIQSIYVQNFLGTLKALPSTLPSTIDAHWIDNGVVSQLKEAA